MVNPRFEQLINIIKKGRYAPDEIKHYVLLRLLCETELQIYFFSNHNSKPWMYTISDLIYYTYTSADALHTYATGETGEQHEQVLRQIKSSKHLVLSDEAIALVKNTYSTSRLVLGFVEAENPDTQFIAFNEYIKSNYDAQIVHSFNDILLILTNIFKMFTVSLLGGYKMLEEGDQIVDKLKLELNQYPLSMASKTNMKFCERCGGIKE